MGWRSSVGESTLTRMSRLPAISAASVACMLGLVWPASAQTSSFYTTRLDDSKAVYLTNDAFAVIGDGAGDDTAAVQAAIDKVQETTGEGIVFVPSGRYRVTNTVYVWGGIRLIGYGATRPVFVLGANTPGYGDPNQEKYMVFFSGNRPGAGRGGRGGGGRGGAPAGAAPPAGPTLQAAGGRGTGMPGDAGAGTFYSAISNIDVEIGDGNPGAVGVRGRYAQHSFIAHSDFRIGSGLAGVHDTGNVMEDVHFHGGDYGIWTERPSPGWQFTVVDATFDGQRVASIRERAAGLTLIRSRFSNVPTAVAVEPTFHDEMWIKDGRFENISGPAVVISNEKNAQTEVNMEDVVCDRVATFARYQESGRTVAGPAARYVVKAFSYGVSYADLGARPETKQVFDAAPLAALPAPVASDLPDLPARDTWVNIRTLGAKGDGTTDDTEVFKKAIAEHHAIYLPSGYYVVTDTLTLKLDTVLIGLHPDRTQIVVPDRTPAFQGVGGPKPLIEAPKNGINILTGIGLYTNGINPRAVAAKWMADATSMLNDVRFLGGHGTSHVDGTRENPYNNTHTADPDLNRRWDAQYPSLWVTDGGGGTFFDIWTASTFAQAGMLVSNTSTEGRIYEMSSEHHVRHEVQLHGVSNWRIYALQTEEERGEGGFALPLEIVNSSHITIANFFIYRVISMFQPFSNAIEDLGIERHSLQERARVQQQQGFVRHDGLRPDTSRRDPAARIRVAHRFRRRARRDRETRAPGHRGRRACAAARRRFLQHLRRRRRSVRQLLLRRQPLAAHLSLERRDASGLDGARQRAGSGESRIRQDRQSARHLVCRQRHGVYIQARSDRRCDYGADAIPARCAAERRGLSTGERLAHQPPGADDARGALRVAGRFDISANRPGLSERRGELRHQEQRTASRFRPCSHEARPACVHHRRIGSDDMVRTGASGWRDVRHSGVRVPWRRRCHSGRARQCVHRRGPDLRL